MLLVLFDKEEEQKRSQRTNPRHPRERLKRKRERDRIKKRADNIQLTYRLWSPCSFCSASRRTSQEQHYHHYHQNQRLLGFAFVVVLFLLLFLLPRCSSSRSSFLVMKNCWRRKKNGDTKSSLGFTRYPKYTCCKIMHSSLLTVCCSSFIHRLVVVVTI